MKSAPDSLTSRMMRKAHDALFNQVHSSTLIYNTCWEDPRLDRLMLELQHDSRVVMITSAGCNALDYLLDDPAEIHAIDVNPRQNALLQLKLALFEHGHFEELFQVFGEGVRPGFRALLDQISPKMQPYVKKYWEKKDDYFKSHRLSPSFFYRGASGRVAWVLMQSLVKRDPLLLKLTQHLVDCGTLEEQVRIYDCLQSALWNVFNSWLMSQPLTMAMLGVPRPQIKLIKDNFAGGIEGFIRAKLEYVFTKLPMKDNYFWRAYITGHYTRECCPNYLLQENFETLRQRASRITTHTTTVSRFLKHNPGKYSHFVLLDHQDWLAAHDVDGLREEWDLILQNSQPGSRILMRSASPEIHFIPATIRNHLKFFPELTARLHQQDRVGTYGSTLLAEVR